MKQPGSVGNDSPACSARAASPGLAEVLRFLYAKDLPPLVTRQVAAERIASVVKMIVNGSSVLVRVAPAGSDKIIFLPGEEPVHLKDLEPSCCLPTRCGRGFYLLVRGEDLHRVVLKVLFDEEVQAFEEISGFLADLVPVFESVLETALLREDLRETIRIAEQGRKRLALTRGRFRSFFQEAPLPYHVLDSAGNLIEVNDSWLVTLGYTSQEVLGTPFSAYVSTSEIDTLARILAEMRGTGEVRSAEFHILKRDGTFIRIRMAGAISYDEKGLGADSHCVFLDVTGQGKIRDLVRQSEKLHNIAGLAAGMAHEINTPLSGIMQAAEIVEMFLDPGLAQNVEAAARFDVDLNRLADYFAYREIDYFLQGIKQAALQASNIIGSLLEFSRPGREKKSRVNLQTLVDATEILVRADYDLKQKYNVINTSFVHDYSKVSAGGCWVFCCAAEIEQVLFSLFKNSVQAMAEAKTARPVVSTKIFHHGGRVRLEIEDNGPGVAENVHRHNFDPFFTTKSPDDTTGLCLTISRTIICENHGGEMSVDPDFRGGARFIIELPADCKEVA